MNRASSLPSSDRSDRQNDRITDLLNALTLQVTSGFARIEIKIDGLTNSVKRLEDRLYTMEAQTSVPSPYAGEIEPFSYETFERAVTLQMNEDALKELVQMYAPCIQQLRYDSTLLF
jgi:hypothetical protein